jgi:hypothetical protein
MMLDLENSLCVFVGVARPKSRLLSLMVRLAESD